MLSPRAIAVQGLGGYSRRLVAVQGLWPADDGGGGLVFGRRRVALPRALARIDEDDALLLLAAAHVAAMGRLF